MNWQALRQQYPNASAAMDTYGGRDEIVAKYCGMDWRDLYDFFDEHGINCHVGNHPDGGGLNKWDWYIKVPAMKFRIVRINYDSWTRQDAPYPDDYDWFTTRKDCERYAFERAFNLLEQRLTHTEPPEAAPEAT